MKILWLTNVPISKVMLKIGSNKIQFGGWLDGISNELNKNQNVQLLTMCPYSVDKVEKSNIDSIEYVIYPSKYKDKHNLFINTIQEFNPDVIHVFGTEFKHSLEMVEACEQMGCVDKLVISIQGLCSKIAKKYCAGLPRSVVNSWTLRDILKLDNIKQQYKKFCSRGKNEIDAIRKCKNVIGRTDWDKACVTQINPKINYFHCNEILRDNFYDKTWNYDNCERQSIFVSQSNYPIKGMHQLIKALPIIKQQFPSVKVYTTGKDLLNLPFKEKLKINGYQKHLINLIKKYKLEDNIKFLGLLNKDEMCERYLKSNCFVSCSSVENSPNSVGEAMMLGVPIVSSDVGGVRTMLKHNEEGYLYPFDEEYMLAYYVCEIFKQGESYKFSKSAQQRAKVIYDKEINIKTLLNVYERLSLFKKSN